MQRVLDLAGGLYLQRRVLPCGSADPSSQPSVDSIDSLITNSFDPDNSCSFLAAQQMPSRKQKTRFQLTVNGVPKELFAIRERSPNQLIILTPRERNIEWEGNQPLVEEHISIHGGERGSGTTIKTTLQSGKGQLLESVQFLLNTPLGWGTVAYAKVCQDLSDARYDLIAGTRDTIVNIAEHNPKNSTFVYAIVVSDNPWNIKNVGRLGMNFKFIKLERFSVGCLFAFQNLPAAPLSQYNKVATSTPRIDKGAYQQLPIETVSRTAYEVAELALHLMRQAVGHNVARIQAWLITEGMDPKVFPDFDPTILTNKPVINTI